VTPAEARDWIAGLQILGMRLGLERIRALLSALGHPERAAPAVHVVGTNGKSSTARLAAAALAGQGLRPGAYLSPHLADWTERIQLGGEPIDDAAFAEVATAVRAAAEGPALAPDDPVTQFEALTAMAFWAFRRAGVGAMAIEAGLGGRWDATNVLSPRAAVVLTNVALEHTEFLGDTEEAIAGDKLAVCADGSDRLAVGPLSPPARAAVDAELARRGIRALRYGEGLAASGDGGLVAVETPRARYPGIPLALRGSFQRHNLALAVAGAEMVVGGALERDGLRRAVAGVAMPGRLEVVPGAPEVVLDGAHNPAGVRALVAELDGARGGAGPVVAVVSALGYKDVEGMVRALAPAAALVVATRSSHPAAAAPERIAALTREAGTAALVVEEPRAALERAREEAGADGTVLVAGSLYLLGDLRPLVLPGGPEPPARLAPARKGDAPPERIQVRMTSAPRAKRPPK
jgi:dihydrofolate synthase/folylpolyglutamate synthase